MDRQDLHISPLSIDLGGKYTGVFCIHYRKGTSPEHGTIDGSVLILPSKNDGVSWLQGTRTARRHQLRATKRRKMAKRLLRLIMENELGLCLTPKQWERVNDLLNRRGYSLPARSPHNAVDRSFYESIEDPVTETSAQVSAR